MGIWIPGGLKGDDGGGGYVPPEWSTGTVEEITEALEKHYNDEIDLTQYWSIGDERVVHLSYMPAYSPLTDTQNEQDVTLTIMHFGGMELKTPINGHTECFAVVGQKNRSYSNGMIQQSGNVNRNWNTVDRHYWCNNTYKNAFLSDVLAWFKPFNFYVTYGGNTSYTGTTTGYFTLPSIKEITGNNTISSETNDIQFDYYKTAANRIKNIADNTPTASAYWTRTLKGYYNCYYIDTNGNGTNNASSVTNYGLAPFGVI